MDPAISACLVVRNEEAAIGRCLASLRGAVAEVVVVHNGACSDATLEIARRQGCRVIEAAAAPYPEWHRPAAYEAAGGEWLLKLDADEFLSEPLRAELPRLAADTGTAGYAFRWRVWDGARYVTRDGPYKLALFRKDAASLVGVPHAVEQVDGPVRRVPLDLEHRPAAGGLSLRKAAAWAPVQAEAYLADPAALPRFNLPAPPRWSGRRRAATALAPLLVVPAGLHTFGHVMRHERSLAAGERLRYAAFQAAARALTTAHVARLRYARGRSQST
jgi:hypothetical protein